ncbi:MAG: hypothetical protein GY802_26545 [Gammaproteobacteria bacterium]|nr:hypothetical protein [Gammaproteobacteria bacterium]
MSIRDFQLSWLIIPPVVMLLLFSLLFAGSAPAAEQNLAFPGSFMLRLAVYEVQDADTDIAVLSDQGVGTEVSFADDLGGDTKITVPRIDAYYRFNQQHRIDFASFRVKREGRKRLDIDITFDDQRYLVDDTLVTEISYELLKIGYSYSFYHSPVVELSATTGFNITSYRFEYERADGSSADRSDASAPLPMFGLRMAYALNSRWSLHYLSETFFVEIDDKLEGSFLSAELNLQYKYSNRFVFGLGVTRVSTDLTSEGDGWKGRINDSHQGILIFSSYYL